MKKFLLVTAAAAAMVAAASPAAAQTNQRHYNIGGLTSENPGGLAELAANVIVNGGLGTRYTALSAVLPDTTTATPTVNVVFTLTGTVNRDCSFYAGNNAAARNIDFGVIGVRNGDNENVTSAFEMRAPAVANANTSAAGCNTNNSVEILKSSAAGLVNSAPGGYDTDEFQANIPYSVTASWTGVDFNVQAAGAATSLTVGTGVASGFKNQGAWRSDMNVLFTAPAPNKGLVAGTYSGTTTLTLRAL